MAKLLLFATHDEAAATLKYTYAKQLDPFFYAYDKGYIAITGIGSYAAQMTVAKHHMHVDEIINLGFSASLKTFAIGDVFICTTIGKYTPLPEALDPISHKFMDLAVPKQKIEEKGMALISSDFPVHSKMQREALQEWDLLDMEGYGIAYACSYFHKKCRIIKVVSDFAKAGGREYIQQHKDELSHILSHSITYSISDNNDCKNPHRV